MPLWVNCIVIIKLKVERYGTIVVLQNTKFKEKKEKENEPKKERRHYFRQQGERTRVASVIDQRVNHYTKPKDDPAGEIKYLYR